MLKKLVESTKTMYLLIPVICLIGFKNYNDLEFSLYPSTSKPTVAVALKSNYDPAIFKERFGKFIERDLQLISEVTDYRAFYRFGSIRYEVEFDWNVSLETAISRVKSAIASHESNLPIEMGKFDVHDKDKTSLLVGYGFSDETMSDEQAYQHAINNIIPKIEATKGVNDAIAVNYSVKNIMISLDAKKLVNLGIPTSKIIEALSTSRFDDNLGRVNIDDVVGNKYIIAEISPNSVEALKNMPISPVGDKPVRLGDVAEIKEYYELFNRLYKLNGERTIILLVFADQKANLVKIDENVKQIIADNSSNNGDTSSVFTLVDPARLIAGSMENGKNSLFLGSIATAIIVLLLIGSLRATVIVFLSIPLTFVLAFILINNFGYTLNLITIGAMAVALGMSVDAGILFLESASRFRAQGFDRVKSASESLKQNLSPMIMSLTTSCIVLIPMVATKGLVKSLLAEFAIIFFLMLLVSFIVSIIFILPFAANIRAVRVSTSPLMRGINKIYIVMLSWLIKTKKNSAAFVCISIVLAGFTLVKYYDSLKIELLPPPDTNELILFIKLKNERSQENVEKLAEKYVADVQKRYGKYISHTLTRAEKREGRIHFYFFNSEDLYLVKNLLNDRYSDTKEYAIFAEERAMSKLSIKKEPTFLVQLINPFDDDAFHLFEKLQDILRGISAITKVEYFPAINQVTNLKFRSKHNSISDQLDVKGIKNIVLDQIRPVTEDYFVKEVVRNNEIIPLYMKYKNEVRTIAELSDFPVMFESKVFPLRTFLDVYEEKVPEMIYTDKGNLSYQAHIYMDGAREKQKEELKQEIFKQLDKNGHQMSNNFLLSDGDGESRQNFRDVGLALIIAILLILMVLQFYFGSIVDTTLAFLTVVFSFIGGVLGANVFDLPVSLNLTLSFILLMGISINNAIIFIHYFRAQGKVKEIKDRLLEIGQARLRPIIVTSLSTSIGLLPIAFGLGTNGKLLQPLGVTIGFGLVTSAFFTVFLLPAFYNLFYRKS